MYGIFSFFVVFCFWFLVVFLICCIFCFVFFNFISDTLFRTVHPVMRFCGLAIDSHSPVLSKDQYTKKFLSSRAEGLECERSFFTAFVHVVAFDGMYMVMCVQAGQVSMWGAGRGTGRGRGRAGGG